MLVGLGSECGNVLLMEALKSWLLIGRANFISTNGLSFALGSQPLQKMQNIYDSSIRGNLRERLGKKILRQEFSPNSNFLEWQI